MLAISIGCKQDDILAEEMLKHSLQMAHILMVTCEVAAILILHLWMRQYRSSFRACTGSCSIFKYIQLYSV